MAEEYDKSGELLVELGSDQTSLHNPFGGGYYPVQLTFEEAQEVMESNPVRFKYLVQERYDVMYIHTHAYRSTQLHIHIINTH